MSGETQDGETIKTRTSIIEENGLRFSLEETVKVKQITKRVSKSVQRRRELKKFGLSANTPRNEPDAGTIFIGDEIILELTPRTVNALSSKEEAAAAAKAPAAAAAAAAGADKGGNGIVMCRICGKVGDHWTLKCPLKDKLQGTSAVADVQLNNTSATGGTRGKSQTVIAAQNEAKNAAAAATGITAGGDKPGKYIPPSLRPGAAGDKKGESMTSSSSSSQRDDSNTVRVANLSSDASEADVRELFSHCGRISRVYLARDNQNISKGYAFVTYETSEGASRAISRLNGHGYDHLILSVSAASKDPKQ